MVLNPGQPRPRLARSQCLVWGLAFLLQALRRNLLQCLPFGFELGLCSVLLVTLVAAGGTIRSSLIPAALAWATGRNRALSREDPACVPTSATCSTCVDPVGPAACSTARRGHRACLFPHQDQHRPRLGSLPSDSG